MSKSKSAGKKGILHVIPNSVVERKEWIVISRRSEVSALSKATSVAKRLGTAALDKRPTFNSKVRNTSDNNQ